MPEWLLSIPLPEDTLGGAAGDAPAARRRVEVQVLDKHDQPLGAPVPLEAPEPVAVEGRGRKGKMAWGRVTPAASLALDVPKGAKKLSVHALGAAPQVFALSALGGAPPPAPDARKRFPAAATRWTLAVLPERFEDEATFFAHCDTLFSFIKGQAPFSDSDVSFGIEALFWKCKPGKTLFGASDNKIKDRILIGDNAVVSRYLAVAGVNPNKALIIINSRKRAGAGGFRAQTPSWTTVTADPPERWEGIALHELGHAFGLADEYDVAFDLKEPNPLEPNVSKNPDPAQVSWKHLCNVHLPAEVPTAKRGQEGGHDLGTVGTFQGARYHPDDRYRPSPFCRMRATTMPFCKVCREQIRAELLK